MTPAWHKPNACTRQGEQRGYILLTLLLIMALVVIGAAAIAPSLAFQIKRDREEELVHRGVQYTRAVRAYAKRTGRYPVRPEELLGGPDWRYIRKLYKDPITGEDFRLLHMGDVQPSSVATNLNASGGTANGVSGASQTTNQASVPSTDSAGMVGQNNAVPGAPAATPGSAAGEASNAGSTGSQPGLLIFGVVSKSKARTIREFNHKDHYNDWLFFYIPSSDRGGEIKGPTPLFPPAPPIQAPIQGQTSNQVQQGTPTQQPSQADPQSQ